MVLVEGRKMAAVANHFGISEGTVKSRVHRIRRKLRAALKGDDA
jgi:DNA-directed RNA polymerase specialized sigma24 family protein